MSIDSSIWLWISELFQHIIGPLLIAVEIAFQQIGKKEDPENGKHDKKLDKDDPPKFAAPGHFPEAFGIENKNFSKH
jgi:hypothetical protein